jgi:membrane-associated protein
MTSSALLSVSSSSSSSRASSLGKKNKSLNVRRHHHHQTRRSIRARAASATTAAVKKPSLSASLSASVQSSHNLSLNNNENKKRGVAAKAAVLDGDREDDEREKEGLVLESLVPPTTTVSKKRSNKLLFFASMFVLAMTASAVLFPETALAKSKAVVAEQSSGFSVKLIVDWILHLDKHLVELFASSGRMAYGVLFAIIFAETGFVVTPFLPGDSLLFACGALGALGVLNFPLVYGLLFVAAVLGDTVNYMCGSFFGQVAIEKNPAIVKPAYIAKTRTFYDKYGGRTVVLARFFVIVRTFAPFIAGVAKMNYSKFALYNVMGAGVWITSFMGLGYFFGNVPVVKENFATTIVVIILLSLLPIVLEIVNHKKDSSSAASA